MDFSDRVSVEQGLRPNCSLSELCLVLVGSIGCGKTLTADNLLGMSSAPGSSTSSRVSQIRQGLSEGRQVSIVETPRWYWRGRDVEADIQEETRRSLSLSVSGPFIFLILIPIGEFTEMEQRIPDQLERMFGQSVLCHTLVLLTCGEYLMGRSLDEYLKKEEGLQEVVKRCHGRCHVISNRRPDDRQQVNILLEKVEQMIKRNGGFHLLRDEETRRKNIREEEKTELKPSAAGDTMWNRGFRGKQTQIETFDKLLEETGRDEIIERRRVNGLQLHQYKSEETHGRNTLPERSPSFKLTKEGAILSQMMEVPEVQHSPSFINTIHHSIKKVSDESETRSPVSPSYSFDLLNDSSLPELRLVLLGRRGSGKSAAGNLILGREEFEVHRDEVTAADQGCVKARALVEDIRVSVVDTPDWFQSEKTPDEVKDQISSCAALLVPGPHVFLLCVPLDQPAQSELPALRALEGIFGPDAVRRHMLILFTRSDLLPEGAGSVEKVETYITSQRPELLELVQRCGDRYHVLRHGNIDEWQSGGVKGLLEKVQQTVKETGGGFYSCSLYQKNQEEIITVSRDRQRNGDRQNPSHPLDTLRETEEEEAVSAAVEKGDRQASAAPPPSLLRSVWEMTSSGVRRVPKLLAVGALTGAALGMFLAGAVGGAVGVAVGTVVTEVGRRRLAKQKTE